MYTIFLNSKLLHTVTLCAFLISCNNNKPSPFITKGKAYCVSENFKPQIKWEAPSWKTVTEGIHLTGSVDPNPDNVVHFISLVDGVISKTNFSLGDKVVKGEILAELQSTELIVLQSQSKTINAQLLIANRKLESVQSMFDDGISSQKDLTEAKSEIDILKAEQERVNASLNLFSASAEKGVFKIKAPASGIITAKNISSGTQISAGEPLFTVSDLDEVWVMANIYATNVQNIKEGMEVGITTLSYPDDVFKGKIKVISQVLDAEAKVLKARIVLPNKDFKLKPGMLVDIIAQKQDGVKALAIPNTAVVFDNSQNYVVVYRDDCDLEIRKVDILTKNKESVFLSDGLKETESIVSENQLLIYEQIKNFQN